MLGAKAQGSEDGVVACGLQWRGGGQALFHYSQGSVLMAVPTKNGARDGPSEVLFNLGPSTYRGFAVTKGGQRVLVNRPASGPDEKKITVEMN